MPVELLSSLAALGDASLLALWLPLTVWTLAASIALLLDDRLTLARPRLRHDVLIALLLALPLGMGMGLVRPVEISLPAPPTIAQTAPQQTPRATPIVSESAAEVSPPTSIPPIATSSFSAPATPAPPLFPLAMGVLTVLAISGATLGLLGWIISRVRLNRWVGGLRRCSASASREALRICDTDAPLSFVADEVTPFTWGVWRPRIVVPFSLVDDPASLRLALLHESAHARSHDPAWDAAARLARSLIWWHPLARALTQRAALRREQAADAAVLSARPDERASYARLLMRYAVSPAPVALAAPLNHLTPRVHAMSLRLASSPRSLPVALLVLLTLSLSLSVRAQDAMAPPDTVQVDADPFRLPPPSPPSESDRIVDDYDQKALAIGPDGQLERGSSPSMLTPQARAAGIEGDVLLRFVITKTGEVRDIEVRRGLGYGLDEAAVANLSAKRFYPAQRGYRDERRSVSSRILDVVRFRLDPSDVIVDPGTLRLTELERTELGLEGVVTDESGEPFGGAAVVQPDGFFAATTGGDGRFTLVLNERVPNVAVRLSAPGYPSRAVALPRDVLENAASRSLRIVGSTQGPRGFVGQVLDAESGEPVQRAEVRIGATESSARTDDEGRFFIALSDLPSDGTVVVSAQGYPGATILNLDGLIYAQREMGRLIPMETSEARNDALSEEWRVRFNPMVALRMGLSQNHYPVNVERVNSDCPELDEAALAVAQAMRLDLRPREAKSGEHAYLLVGCDRLRGGEIGTWARPMPTSSIWIEHEMRNSERRSDDWPHVLFRADITESRRYVSPTVLRSDCPTRNDAALRFVTDRMNLMPSTLERWMTYRDNMPPTAIGSIPCYRLEAD